MLATKLTNLQRLVEGPRRQDVLRVPLGVPEIDSCLQGGLLPGALHEVFATSGNETAATGFVFGLASLVMQGKTLLWIYRDFLGAEFGHLSPTGLVELGLQPDRVLLFSAASLEDELRAANDALSCVGLGAVVIEISGNPAKLDLVASRRLTLAASRHAVTVFLLRLRAGPEASAAETRWQIETAPSPLVTEQWGRPRFCVDLIRNRQGQTGSWVVEWNCDEPCFQTPAQADRPVVSQAAY